MVDKQSSKGKKTFLAYAPIFPKKTVDQPENPITYNGNMDEELDFIKFSRPSVEELGKMLGGGIFLDYDATEASFLENAPKYDIVHLSTHGVVSDKLGDYSYLAFTKIKDDIENEKLYNRELYNLNLDADMVVLSACETGFGELQRGEGIISLARGFAYAGTKSIVSSLWSVNDLATKDLMKSFYENLKKGMSKDDALHKAKMDFRNNPKRDNHPFYWAAFIPTGDMSSLELGNPSCPGWLYIALGILSLGLISILIKRIQ